MQSVASGLVYASAASEIQTAIDAVEAAGGGVVLLEPARTYSISTTITIPDGVCLQGGGGHADSSVTVLHGTMTSGSVVRMQGRSAKLCNVRITASAGRQAGSGHGVELRKPGQTTTTSRITIEDVDVQSQPGDGFHLVSGELCRISTCTATSCGRFGFYLDDGTEDGESTIISFFNNVLENCRAIFCDRAGLNMRSSTAVNTFTNFQALGCDIDETDGYQAICAGASNVFFNIDCEDQQYSDNGKLTPSEGLSITGQNNSIFGGHFSSLTRSIDCNTASQTHILGIRVFEGTYGVAQPHAVFVRSNCDNVFIHIDDDFGAGATKPIQNQSTSTIYFQGGGIYLGNTTTVFDDDLVKLTIGDGTTKTIASDIARVTAGFHILAAATGTADDLNELRDNNGTAGAGTLRTGQRVTLMADAGDTITVQHNTGTVSILLAGSTSFAMTGNDTLTVMFNGTSWVEVSRSEA